jgi:hypothetical protein
MPATVVGDHAEAVLREEQHLAVPSGDAQGPAMRERYGRAFAPVRVVDLRPVFGRDCTHRLGSAFGGHVASRGPITGYLFGSRASMGPKPYRLVLVTTSSD